MSGLKRSEEAANVERKIVKDLQNTWRTAGQDHFEKLQECLPPWMTNIF